MGKIQEEAEFRFPAYELPVPAVTNHHQLSGLKRYTCFMFYFTILKSEVRHRSHWAEIKESSGLYSFLEALGENPFSHLFRLLEAVIFLACDRFLRLQCKHHQAKSFSYFHLFGFLSVCFPFPSFQNPYNYIGHTQITQDNLCISRSADLTTLIYLQPLPCNLRYLQVLGNRIWTFFRDQHSAYRTWCISGKGFESLWSMFQKAPPSREIKPFCLSWGTCFASVNVSWPILPRC